jgi:phage tail-like protein
VEIDNVIKGGFTDVSGLSIQTDVDTVKEGGVNDFEHKLPKGTKYTDIILKRGIIDWHLWDWYHSVVQGQIVRKKCTISLRDSEGKPVYSWFLIEAFPVKWEGPTLNATSNNIASESLVLTHHGLLKV